MKIMECAVCGAKFTEGNGGGIFKEFHWSREYLLCPDCSVEMIKTIIEVRAAFIKKVGPITQPLTLEQRALTAYLDIDGGL